MTAKAKLISTISAFCLILALLVTGVWALSTTSIEIGGSINFTASNINATIAGEITGLSEGTYNPTKLVYTRSSSPTTTALNSWKKDLTFDENATPITYSITIQNDNSDRSLLVSIEDTSQYATEVEGAITIDGENKTSVEIAENTSSVIAITMKVRNEDQSFINAPEYRFAIKLTDENMPEDTVVEGMEFEYWASTSNTAQVTGITATSTMTEIVIPDNVYKDGVNYIVTGTLGHLDGGGYVESLTLGKNITSIFTGDSGTGPQLSGWNKMTVLTVKATTPPTIDWKDESAEFPITNYWTALKEIRVPADSIEAYKNAEVWKDFVDLGVTFVAI